MAQLPPIEDIAEASLRSGLAADPPELHGALCGWLSAGGEDTVNWPARVLADDALPAPEAGSPLDELRTTTSAQLEDRGFGFELLLPEIEDSLNARADALFEWCRGFLGGFGLAAGAHPPLSEEAEEALQDLARLAQAAPESSDDDEDEHALAEIEEFVRVAVLLLHGDCVLAPRHRQSLN
ncbi:MAG: UPF0149 family protein [Pseudoxanthomonas sp.]